MDRPLVDKCIYCEQPGTNIVCDNCLNDITARFADDAMRMAIRRLREATNV